MSERSKKKLKDTVLSKPLSREETEALRDEKKRIVIKRWKIAAAGIAIVAIIAVLVNIQPFKGWINGIFTVSPEYTVNEYINGVDQRNIEKIKKTLSPQMLESFEERLATVPAGEDFFDKYIFPDDLKTQFGDDVTFSFSNFECKEINLDDENLYYTDDDLKKYNITAAQTVTCDLTTSGKLNTEVNKTFIVCISIDGKWYLDSMNDITPNNTQNVTGSDLESQQN